MPDFKMPSGAADWARALKACGVNGATAETWGPVFASLKPTAFSQGPTELLDFLPTVLHESAMLERLKENGNYSAQRIRELGNASPPGSRWRSLVPRADALARNETAFFEACYGGRLGNRPEGSGDGARYPGRGLIMLTGADGYRWQGERSGQDLLVNPQLAEQPYYALGFAVDWWEGRVPDAYLGDTKRIRRAVNGGDIGLQDVQRLKALATRALQA